MWDVKNLITDCDGVLTDGRYYYSKEGKQLVAFHANDSVAVKVAKDAGLRVAIISSTGDVRMVEQRAKDIGMECYYTPYGEKLKKAEELEFDLSESAYVGDCIDDIPMLKASKVSFVPLDALEIVKNHADYVLSRGGGCGCLLEVICILGLVDERSYRV